MRGPLHRPWHHRRAAPRAFTLVEMMVASVIAFILVAAGSSLASAMARNVRRAEELGDLGARAAVAHSFLANLLSATAYNWAVPHKFSASTTSGSLGEGACTTSTGLCTAKSAILPLRICKSSTVDKATCDAPVAAEADALWTYVPRDDIIEAVSIADRNGTALTSACTSSNVPATVVFDVKGVTSTAWAVDDLVLVARGGHASFGTVQAAFAANASATASRTLSLDIGDGGNLDNDDGTLSGCASAISSLKGARVMRVRQVVIKLSGTTLIYGHRDSGSAALTLDPLVNNVDDLQFQFDVAHLPSSGSAGICTSDDSTILSGSNFGSGNCNGEDLNGVAANGSVNRVLGLRIGIILRTAVETQTNNLVAKGLFDRATTNITVAAGDKRVRRTSLLYVGLPNASNL